MDPTTVDAYRRAAGLPNQNPGRFVIEGRLRDRAGIDVRRALPLDGNPGGLTEWLVPRPLEQIDVIRVRGLNPPL